MDNKRPTVAVVGGGIAGLGAAHALAARHMVELFDAGAIPGGHARTIEVGGVALDTGFIVYNERNYPRLTRLFGRLGVRTQPSTMSFSVECGCGVRWSSRRPWRAGHRLVREIGRFLRTADRDDAASRTLEEFVRDEGYSESFARHYLQPMTAAIWSAAPEGAMKMPASFVLSFFRNHGLLGLRRHRWRTVVGGSRRYVQALLEAAPVTVRSEALVHQVHRDADGVWVATSDGERRRFDAAVLAVAAPRALAMLSEPSDEERRLLAAFETTRNETVLHTDARFLPRSSRDRAAWNYHADDCSAPASRPTVTYSANRLQRLRTDTEYCITLNRTEGLEQDTIIAVHEDEHPRMTPEAVAAQPQLARLNGSAGVAFAGAWQGYGFHEDGLVSGLRAAAALERRSA